MAKMLIAFWTCSAIAGGAVYAVAGDAAIPASRAWTMAQNQVVLDSQRKISTQLNQYIINQEIGKRDAAQGRADELEISATKATNDADRVAIEQKRRKEIENVRSISKNIDDLSNAH